MKLKYFFLFLFYHTISFSIPHIPPKENIIQFLKQQKLQSTFPRLHLGCGQSHLTGYINIDFPPAEHTVQIRAGADIFGDITQLIFPENSIAEIRLHHVFEHFPRQKALALLAIWHHSLKPGGILFLETPDFEESIRMMLDDGYSYLQKQVVLRHIFGSHEAHWAMHYDGWYDAKYRHILSGLGFELISVEKSSYLVTRNITVKAVKKNHLTSVELQQRAHTLLREHMVNRNPDEQKMWQVWCEDFDRAFFPFIVKR